MNIPANFDKMSVAEKMAWLKTQTESLSTEKNAEVEKIKARKLSLIKQVKECNAQLKQLGALKGRPTGSVNKVKETAKHAEKAQVLNVLKAPAPVSGVTTGGDVQTVQGANIETKAA